MRRSLDPALREDYLTMTRQASLRALPAVTGRKTHALVAGSQYLEYPGIGHYLPFEAKQRLLDDLLAFLDRGSEAV